MILRRIIAHFRKQEWTAIAIDFVIVVVGVFVGLQVNNWNEARGERAREAFAIAALRSDFQALDFSVSHGVCWHRRSLDGLQVIAEALNAGRLDPEDEARFENGLRFGYLHSSTNKASGTLSELLSSGNMGLLRDPQLRAALIEYEGSRETAAGSGDDLQLIATNYIRPFTNRFDYDLQRDHFRSDRTAASPSTFPPSAIMISTPCWPTGSFGKPFLSCAKCSAYFLSGKTPRCGRCARYSGYWAMSRLMR